MHMKNLKDLVVVITGASSGIGLESARRFADAGARTVLLARSSDRLASAERAVKRSVAIALDITDESAVQNAFADIEQRVGPVDILVNNAGTGFATDLSTVTLEDYRKIFETNVTGVFLCSRAVLPSMKRRKSGHIINISSIVGKVANPNAPLYCASKFALNGYTSGLQQQLAADKVRVSMVSPSAVNTAYWGDRPVDRTKFLKPEEVAAAVLFVASQPDGVLIKDIDLTAIR
jgi:NADP-dependent 3-hydroxy acid dehydrogenase YdfG